MQTATTNKEARRGSLSQPRQGLLLRVLTLNTWGVPLVSEDRMARMTAIGVGLSAMHLDAVAFQEVFLEEDRRVLAAHGKVGGLLHSHYFQSGIFRTGLFILSRYPFDSANFWPYRLNGRPQDLRRPDFYAGKGLARVRMQTPFGPVDLYNTHLIAPYLEIGEDIYFAHRVAQAYELVKFVREASLKTPCIIAGDMNTTPERLTYRVCCEWGGFEDSYRETNPDDPGITVSTDIPYLAVHEPERIDYIFYRNRGRIGLEALASEVVFKEVAEELQGDILAYSDHYGVLTTFDLGAEDQSGRISPSLGSPVPAIRSAWKQGLEQAQHENRTYQLRTGLGILVLAVTSLAQCRGNITRAEFLRFVLLVFTIGVMLLTGISLTILGNENREVRVLQELLAELKDF